MHKLNEILENYCEKIEKELGDLYVKINKTDTLSTQDLDAMDKLLHALKSTKTVWAMIEYGDVYSDTLVLTDIIQMMLDIGVFKA